ncbi:MAG: FKBP-type peptidyl-prolyl cis-trans isomerase [Flavobacteriales bacterium]|nr:FKBP-type peptidyl-prolyl cis-trans isomerase [Flavobacteriales bacterium]
MALSACNNGKEAEVAIDLNQEADKVSYSIGVNIGKSLQMQKADELKPEIIAAAMKDVFAEAELKVSEDDAKQALQTYFGAKEQAMRAEQEKEMQVAGQPALEKGREFLEANKQEEGVVVTESGLQYKVLKKGSGAKPTASDMVKVHYTGTLLNGNVFDSSVERGEPAIFAVNQVIPGWTEALQLMPVGSKWKVFIPGDLAYGLHSPTPKIGPNETLIFEVELIEIMSK